VASQRANRPPPPSAPQLPAQHARHLGIWTLNRPAAARPRARPPATTVRPGLHDSRLTSKATKSPPVDRSRHSFLPVRPVPRLAEIHLPISLPNCSTGFGSALEPPRWTTLRKSYVAPSQGGTGDEEALVLSMLLAPRPRHSTPFSSAVRIRLPSALRAAPRASACPSAPATAVIRRRRPRRQTCPRRLSPPPNPPTPPPQAPPAMLLL